MSNMREIKRKLTLKEKRMLDYRVTYDELHELQKLASAMHPNTSQLSRDFARELAIRLNRIIDNAVKEKLKEDDEPEDDEPEDKCITCDTPIVFGGVWGYCKPCFEEEANLNLKAPTKEQKELRKLFNKILQEKK